ncbi:OmpA/MotB family protein [Marinomonas fungiae]|uniref:Flagellar motor protein MotB n=1 Tax=Marinomonas fungiae TaxID=1137284 RepID=A0A0K6ILW7_9GAMM|nr:OmpA family protein [Marinomonas fungiae]CUB04083.1 Flagellar motor protein MotB [Marinomonas fungiae]
MRVFKSGQVNVDEENPYWMSFSDILSGLLILFVLASVVLMVELMEAKQELENKQEAFTEELEMLHKAEQVRRTLLHEIADSLRQMGIQVTISENETVLSIPNDILGFDSAAFNIGPKFETTALEIGKVLFKKISLDKSEQYFDTIFIEGHTDSKNFNGMMGKGNWGLSTFRAISLWELWSSSLPEDLQLDNLKNQDGNPLFSVSGYAATRRAVESEATEQDYRANRRIDIRFTIRRPSSEEYESVRNRLEMQ